MDTRASFICLFYPMPFFALPPPPRTATIRGVPSYRRCDIKYQVVGVVSILILRDAQKLDTIRADPLLILLGGGATKRSIDSWE